MPNAKLVSLPVDAEGKVELAVRLRAQAHALGWLHAGSTDRMANELDRAADLIDALPEAVMVGEGDKQEIALLVDSWAFDERNRNATKRTEQDAAMSSAAAILRAGYRKTAILDRFRLIEEIAKAFCALRHHLDPEDCNPCIREAEAILSRLQAETP